MTETAVIVPYKSRGVKSRLSSLLSPEDRGELSMAMLASVLGVLKRGGLIGSTFVVTSDRGGGSMARRLGARVVPEEEDRGVNRAVEAGLSASESFPDVLVLPSDLPLLSRSDVSSLLGLKGGGLDAVLAPSRAFDGTNAYLFTRGDRVPLLYDRDSFWGHLEGLAGLGLRVGVSTRPGVTFDVDSPEDLWRLASSASDSPPARMAKRALR